MRCVMLRKVFAVIAFLTMIGVPSARCVLAETPQTLTPQDAQEIAFDATVYGFPLVIMDLTRQVFTAVSAPESLGAPANQFGNKRVFPDASFTTVVRPNADTLYSSAWIDTSPEPIVLSLPDTQSRYYLMPMLNMWTDAFASPGSRTTGCSAGEYAITGPSWSGALPVGLTEVGSSTRFVWIVGRFACAGPSDYESVWSIQDLLELTPLSAWGTADYQPPAEVPVDPEVDTTAAPLAQLLAMSAAEYLGEVCRLMVDNPPYLADGPLLAKLAELGIEAGADYSSHFAGLDDVFRSAIEAGYRSALASLPTQSIGTIKNGWWLPYGTGSYGTDYMLRAATAYQGLGANLVADAFYPTALTDESGDKLSSDRPYVLHFSKDEIPPVDGFWSLSMYNDRIMFVDNRIGRYCLGSLSDPPLVRNPDGSLDIYLQRDPPAVELLSNWLPTPQSGGFQVTLRLYWPRQPVLDRTWVPPALRAVP